ncbi:MAG: zf-HC2 domain-containing protein, partial [Actinomycetota bacterium]
MKCETAERELSARLDGAGDARLDAAVASHLATCHSCRAFRARSERVRELVRVRPADPVPDLVPRIMAEVRRGAAVRPFPTWRRDWGRAAAAFAAGVVAAVVVTGGLPAVRRSPPAALATEIPRRIARASAEVAAYRATFHVVEHGFRPAVPRRTFMAEVAFRAPERFRARIVDRTSYPGDVWPRNDLVLAVDEDRWMLDAPRGCPREALPACAPAGRDVRVLEGRPPFDAESLLPTDVILPVRTLAGTGRVRVVGEREVLGRPGVTIELFYRDATPLFDYLLAGGVWRPFYSHDRVLVTLDAGSWFPLAYEVRAAGTAERDLWAMRTGLGVERPGRLLLRAEARSLGPGPPPGWRPYTGGRAVRDLGFAESSFGSVAAGVPAPSRLGGLDPYRAGTVGD